MAKGSFTRGMKCLNSFLAQGVLPKRLQESLLDFFITEGSFPKGVHERGRERESSNLNLNLKTLFYKDCRLDLVKKLSNN